jgi:hypothetical protein
MEFILTIHNTQNQTYNADISLSELEHVLNAAPRLCPLDGEIKCFHTEDIFFATSQPLVNTKDIISFWDGHGFAKNYVFSSGTKLAFKDSSIRYYIDALNGNTHDSDTLDSDIRGVFSCGFFNIRSGEFAVAHDPLSQYPTFIFQHHETLIVSNNIYWIEAFATSFGYPLKRSVTGGAMEALFGIGAGDQTGFDTISLFPHSKLLTGTGAAWAFKKAKHPDYKGLSYNELLETAANRLTAYMKALDHAANGKDLLFDLTGGLDSRLCFAAALSANVQNLTIFSGGDDQNIDKLVAYDIAAKFNVCIGNYPSNHDGSQTSHCREAQIAVFRSQGHSNLYHHDLGPLRLESVSRVRGSAGELTRHFKIPPAKNILFWKRPLFHLKQLVSVNAIYRTILHTYFKGLNKGTKRRAVRWAYAYMMKPKALRQLFTKRFQAEAVTRIYDGLKNPKGISNDIGMDLYLSDRTKRHFGFNSRALNMVYGVFEPLYDPVLLAAAEALPISERVAGRLSFDLIEKLGGKELLALPYAPQSLNAHQRLYLSKRLDIAADWLIRVPEKLAPLENTCITSANYRNITTLGTTPPPNHLGRHGTYLWQNRAYFRKLIDAVPKSHDCWSIFNRQALRKATTDTGYFYKNERTATHGLRIFHTLIWITKGEFPSGITALHQFEQSSAV